MTAKILIGAIRVYQLALSPLLGGSCRFLPTCSAYAIEALRAHGAVRGTLLAARRLAACHPFGRSGFDPVPAPPVLGGTLITEPGAGATAREL